MEGLSSGRWKNTNPTPDEGTVCHVDGLPRITLSFTQRTITCCSAVLRTDPIVTGLVIHGVYTRGSLGLSMMCAPQYVSMTSQGTCGDVHRVIPLPTRRGVQSQSGEPTCGSGQPGGCGRLVSSLMVAPRCRFVGHAPEDVDDVAHGAALSVQGLAHPWAHI